MNSARSVLVFITFLIASSLTNTTSAQLKLVEETYESGKKKAIYKVDGSNRRVGRFMAYYESGRVRIKASYQKGLLHGPYEESFDNGKRKQVRSFRNGELLKSSTFDAKGRLTYRQGRNRKGAWIQDLPSKNKIRAYPRNRQEVEERLAVIDPKKGRFETFEFAQPPEISPTATPGRLSSACVDDAVRLMNALRYLSGLPHDVEARDDLNHLCSCAALTNRLNGKNSHRPGRPDGIDDDDYRDGCKGAQQSNLHLKQVSLRRAIGGFMDDSGPKNISAVGHRRWILSPRMKSTGFGVADGFVAMHAHNQDRPATKITSIAYPGRGYFPIEYLRGPRVAWSYAYKTGRIKASEDGVKVRIWQLDDDLEPTREIQLNYNELSPVSLYGMKVVVFRAKWGSDVFKAGLRVLVQIRGLEKSGKPMSVAYVVHLI